MLQSLRGWKPMNRSENVQKLATHIKGCGGPDKYIDEDEEADIFRKGDELGIKKPTVEAVLNQMCRDDDWTREKEIIEDLKDQLDETTEDDGVIDKNEFEHCVNYAVKMNMPRRRAMELGVQYVIKNNLKIKKSWFVDWFEPLRQKYQE
jgi:hypothetical protein